VMSPQKPGAVAFLPAGILSEIARRRKSYGSSMPSGIHLPPPHVGDSFSQAANANPHAANPRPVASGQPALPTPVRAAIKLMRRRSSPVHGDGASLAAVHFNTSAQPARACSLGAPHAPSAQPRRAMPAGLLDEISRRHAGGGKASEQAVENSDDLALGIIACSLQRGGRLHFSSAPYATAAPVQPPWASSIATAAQSAAAPQRKPALSGMLAEIAETARSRYDRLYGIDAGAETEDEQVSRRPAQAAHVGRTPPPLRKAVPSPLRKAIASRRKSASAPSPVPAPDTLPSVGSSSLAQQQSVAESRKAALPSPLRNAIRSRLRRTSVSDVDKAAPLSLAPIPASAPICTSAPPPQSKSALPTPICMQLRMRRVVDAADDDNCDAGAKLVGPAAAPAHEKQSPPVAALPPRKAALPTPLRNAIMTRRKSLSAQSSGPAPANSAEVALMAALSPHLTEEEALLASPVLAAGHDSQLEDATGQAENPAADAPPSAAISAATPR
jgi:hypothetical protein